MRPFETEVKAAISEVLELSDAGALTPETALEADLGMDSGLMLELVIQLEDTVEGLVIDQVTLSADDFRTVGSVCGYVAERVAPPVPA